MRLRASLALLLGAFAATGPALAASSAGEFAAKGPGRVPCSAYVDARTRNLPAVAQFISYIEGYITAANRYEPNTYDLAPWHTPGEFAAILDQHCKANGQDTLAVASLKLATALNPIRMTESSPLIEVRDGTNVAVIYESVLRRVQDELKRKGLFTPAPDGKFSPATKAALLAFQTRSKLPATGVPDTATVWTLLNP